jgi:hypothetical protein
MSGNDLAIISALALMAGASLPAIAQDRSNQEQEVAARLDQQLALMNKQAPIQINSSQKLTSANRAGKKIIYSIETAVPQDQWTQEMRERPKLEITQVMCTDMNMLTLLDFGYELHYLFADSAGLSVTSFVVTRDKCPS